MFTIGSLWEISADLSQGDIFEKPWFYYSYKWIPKLLFAPKGAKPFFLCVFTSTHNFLLTTSGTTWIGFYRKDWKFQLKMFDRRSKRPGLYLKQVWKRGMGMWVPQQEHLLLQVYVWVEFLLEEFVEARRCLVSSEWLIFGSEGFVFCSLEEKRTFFQGNEWILLPKGLAFLRDWIGLSIHVGSQEWDFLGESTMGNRQGRIRTRCDCTTWLVFMLPRTSPTTQRPPSPLRMPQLPPQRRGRAFLLGNKGAWVITALPVVSTAGWHKSHWKCLNYIINLQAINFPSLTTQRFNWQAIIFFFLCSLGVSFCSLSRMEPRSGSLVLNMSG